MIREALYYGRMAWFYGGFVRTRPAENPADLLKRSLERRGENFLELARVAVFDNPRTPYHELMRLAGCAFGDLAASVRQRGLEATLLALKENGVFLTHAEAKGAPVYRHGREIPNNPAATAHPLARGGMEVISGGSRSAGTATVHTNAYLRHRELYEAVVVDELEVRGHAFGSLLPILPSPWGLHCCASMAGLGKPIERWFDGGSFRASVHYRAATRVMAWQARLLGRAVPSPTYLPHDDYRPVATWIQHIKREGRQVFLRSRPSAATRVCSAAREAGIDIAGTVFLTQGEALTGAKQEVIRSVGASAYSRYVLSEVGIVGNGCRQMNGDSVHVFTDSVAAIASRRRASYADAEVDALLLTSVHPWAARVFINVDMEDAGLIAEAECDCALSRIGFRTVLRDVHSFGKITGHGLTLPGDLLLAILEHRLPERFGGDPGDYQLVEQQGEAQVEVRLRVSSRVGPLNTTEVREFFLDQIGGVHGGAISRRTWEHTSSFAVEVAEPFRTGGGKVLPVHLATFADAARHRHSHE